MNEQIKLSEVFRKQSEVDNEITKCCFECDCEIDNRYFKIKHNGIFK